MEIVKYLRPINKKGQSHGYWEEYHWNGNLYYKGNYINGEPDGYWEMYRVNGEPWYKGVYHYGIEIGLWELYNENGELIEQHFYA